MEGFATEPHAALHLTEGVVGPVHHPDQKRIGRFILASVILHLAAVLVMWPLGAWTRATTPAPVVTPVRIVTWDKLTMDAPSLPKGTSTEVRAGPAPKKKKTSTPQSDAPPRPVKHPAATPAPDTPKPDPNAEALASLEDFLSDLEKEAAEEDDTVDIPDDAWVGGSGVPEGAGEPGGIVVAGYLDLIKADFKRNWSEPPGSMERGLTATVRVTLLPDGTIHTYDFIHPSGDTVFDVSVERAIAKAAPLDPFPPSIEADSLTIDVNFDPKEVQQ